MQCHLLKKPVLLARATKSFLCVAGGARERCDWQWSRTGVWEDSMTPIQRAESANGEACPVLCPVGITTDQANPDSSNFVVCLDNSTSKNLQNMELKLRLFLYKVVFPFFLITALLFSQFRFSKNLSKVLYFWWKG